MNKKINKALFRIMDNDFLSASDKIEEIKLILKENRGTALSKFETDKGENLLHLAVWSINFFSEDDKKSAAYRNESNDTVDLINFLISKGVQVEKANAVGETPLYIACYIQNHEISDTLIDKYHADILYVERYAKEHASKYSKVMDFIEEKMRHYKQKEFDGIVGENENNETKISAL